MAIVRKEREKSLTVQVNLGSASSPVYKTYTFNYFDPNSDDDNVYTCGQKIGACIDATLEAVGNVEKYELREEA